MIDPEALRRNYGMILNVALGVVAVVVWLAPVPKLHILALRNISAPMLSVLPAGGGSQDMQQLINRPVFAQSRRPPPVAAHPVVNALAFPPAPSTDGLVLLGVLHAGTRAVALVAVSGEGQPREIAVGAKLGDWVVKDIMTDRVVLQSGTISTALVLPRPSAPPAASAGPAAIPQAISPFQRIP